MLQRGRRSSASFVVPPVDGSPPRLEPPASLGSDERDVFLELVAATDRRHFRQSDMPLLASYCRAAVLEQRSARELAANPLDHKWLAVWEKSTRALVSLSLRLKLSPQSRQHPKTTARMPERIGRQPWD
jgi:hypothetical protein